MVSTLFKTFAPIVDLLPERLRIELVFFYKHRKKLNLNPPISFNEKINWRKIFDRNPKFCELADKLAVKPYVETFAIDVVVPKVLWQGDTLEDLVHFSNLPKNYVIKANNGSGTNYIVRNGEHLDVQKLRKLESEWRSVNIGETFVEWGYSNIPIKFFVEEFLDFEKDVPTDYKFWVFSGKVHYIQVDADRFVNHQRSFYDTSWNKLPFLLTYPDICYDVSKPNNLTDMIKIAEVLSGEADFLRVDLYSDGNNVYFGEITIYPGSGYERFQPKSYDLIVGKLWPSHGGI